MKRSFRRTAIRLVTPGATTALLLSASPCLAAPTAGELPWDQTLTGSGIGGCVALLIVHVLNYVLP